MYYLLQGMDIGHIQFQSCQNLLRFAQWAVHRGFLIANVFFLFYFLWEKTFCGAESVHVTPTEHLKFLSA